jgi:hypothetical protein
MSRVPAIPATAPNSLSLLRREDMRDEDGEEQGRRHEDRGQAAGQAGLAPGD